MGAAGSMEKGRGGERGEVFLTFWRYEDRDNRRGEGEAHLPHPYYPLLIAPQREGKEEGKTSITPSLYLYLSYRSIFSYKRRRKGGKLYWLLYKTRLST